MTNQHKTGIEVSIPFKRERTVRRMNQELAYYNGRKVSIPFKRERTFRLVYGDSISVKTRIRFQFPSNGNAHSDRRPEPARWIWEPKFQFPSNGNAHSDEGVLNSQINLNAIVSIPFKRERTFRQTPFSTHWGRGFRTPKPNAKCTSLFLCQKLPQKARKPTCPLTQTRFFYKNGSEVRHRLCSWAI